MQPPGDTILVVLIAGIGDLIMASKAIRAIRNGHPKAEIHLLTSTEAVTLAKNYPYVDHVWAFPVRELRNRKAPLADVFKLIGQLRKIDFGLAVNIYRVYSWTGALKMGLLFLPLRAMAKVGHDHRGFGFFLTKKVPLKNLESRHFADAMIEIAQGAGGVPDEKGIEVFRGGQVESKWECLSRNRDIVRIAVNPGADHPKKRWPAARFAAVADQLIGRFRAEIILLGGPGEEHLAREIQENMKEAATNLAGRLTLNDLVYVISRMDLLLTNDSGPMHIAAALRTPLVALFGPENPKHFGPYTTPDLYRVLFKDVACRPCENQRCSLPQCLDLIPADEVLEKCTELLALRE